MKSFCLNVTNKKTSEDCKKCLSILDENKNNLNPTDYTNKKLQYFLLLKEYKFRWYLIAKDLNSNKIKTFGLDRIYNVTSSNRKFKTSNIQEIKDSFKNSFGIICPENGIVKEIILAFEPEQGQYIKSLPLHLSQEILKDNHDEVWVKLNLFITQDFIIELLSHGAALTVLKPKSLANTIKKIHERAAQNY